MDFKTIFGEEALTLAQFQEKTKGMKLVDLNTGEYVDKRKFDSEHAELVKAKETIKSLEASKGDTEALQKQIDEYKAANEKRNKEAQEAQAKADMDARFTAAVGDKEFASDLARDGAYAKFVAAVNDPSNKGKGDNELFAGFTKDVDCVFKSKNPPAKMGGVKTGTTGAGRKTKEEIIKIKDPAQRQKAIFENRELFGI